jgi:hypothetical protein
MSVKNSAKERKLQIQSNVVSAEGGAIGRSGDSRALSAPVRPMAASGDIHRAGESTGKLIKDSSTFKC